MQPYRFRPEGIPQQPLWAGNGAVLTAELLAQSLAQPAVPGAGPGASSPTSQQAAHLPTAQQGSTMPAHGANTQGLVARPAPHPSPLPAGPGPASSCVALSAKYDLLGRIGEGTYGVVYLAASREQPGTRRRLFAIKTFKTGRVSLTSVWRIQGARDKCHETKAMPEFHHAKIALHMGHLRPAQCLSWCSTRWRACLCILMQRW